MALRAARMQIEWRRPKAAAGNTPSSANITQRGCRRGEDPPSALINQTPVSDVDTTGPRAGLFMDSHP